MVKSKYRFLDPNTTNSSLTGQTEMEKLEAWIKNFVFSFSPSKLRSVLETARFLRRHSQAWQINPFKVVSGLAVVISCDSCQDYNLLVVKSKQLAYRIRKLDPQVDLLMLLSPDQTIMSVTVIATMERLMLEHFQRQHRTKAASIREQSFPLVKT